MLNSDPEILYVQQDCSLRDGDSPVVMMPLVVRPFDAAENETKKRNADDALLVRRTHALPNSHSFICVPHIARPSLRSEDSSDSSLFLICMGQSVITDTSSRLHSSRKSV